MSHFENIAWNFSKLYLQFFRAKIQTTSHGNLGYLEFAMIFIFSAESSKIWFSNTVIGSSGEIQVGVSRGDFHFFEVFSPKVHLWVYEDEGGDLERQAKLCRFVIRKNVACFFSCSNSKRTFFLKIFKRFWGVFAARIFLDFLVTAIFEEFSAGFGSLRNKRIFAVFAPSGLSKKGRWPLMQRLREFV